MHTRRPYSAVFLLGLALVGVACDPGTEPIEPGPPAVLTILPPADTVNTPRDSARFVVRVTDAAGVRVPDAEADVAWSTPDWERMSFRSDGWVIGFATPEPLAIVATLGELADTAWLLVRQIPARVEFDYPELELFEGAGTRMSPWVYDSGGAIISDPPLQWRSTDTAAVTVDTAGRVTARNAGYAWVVATAPPATDSAAVTVVAVEPVRFVAVDAGYVGHACALSDGGRAYCWGLNTYGELGVGYARNGPPLPTAVATDRRFVEIIAGNRHSCARTGDGEVWCWGEASFNGGASPDICAGLPCTNTPRRVEGIPPIVSLHGTRGTCGLTAEGEAWCFADEPFQFLPDRSFLDVITTEQRFCGLTALGKVWCAVRQYTERPRSESYVEASDPSFVALSAGYSHYCALNEEGDAFCWGSNGGGQLGAGHEYGRETPTLVVEGHRYRSISGGGYTGAQDIISGKTNTCAVGVDDRGYCWGLNTAGQVGNGVRTVKCHVDDPHYPTICEPRPVPVAGVPTFESISAGGTFACGIGGDGILYCWGSNDWGQLGVGGEHLAPDYCDYWSCALTPARVLGQPDDLGGVP